jgi:hypothetical protein
VSKVEKCYSGDKHPGKYLHTYLLTHYLGIPIEIQFIVSS